MTTAWMQEVEQRREQLPRVRAGEQSGFLYSGPAQAGLFYCPYRYGVVLNHLHSRLSKSPQRLRRDGTLDVMTICSYTSGVFIWDENKRRANLRKHGVDFADAETIFAGYTVTAEGIPGTALRFARAASRCCGLRNVYRTSRQNPDYLYSKGYQT